MWRSRCRRKYECCALQILYDSKDQTGKSGLFLVVKYLDMCLIQRSGDMLTASGAGGINEIQYAALQMMIAKSTGYEPGVFTHFVANEQIYDRHIDNANEMLRRAEEAEASDDGLEPALVLNKEPGCDFKDITLEDFELTNYRPMKPQLVFELGI